MYRCDCRSSCSSTPPVLRCQGSCVECQTHKLASCVILPRCPTPSSSLTMTYSNGLDICPSGDVLSYWRVVHTASQGYPRGLKGLQNCPSDPSACATLPETALLYCYFYIYSFQCYSSAPQFYFPPPSATAEVHRIFNATQTHCFPLQTTLLLLFLLV